MDSWLEQGASWVILLVAICTSVQKVTLSWVYRLSTAASGYAVRFIGLPVKSYIDLVSFLLGADSFVARPGSMRVYRQSRGLWALCAGLVANASPMVTVGP